MTSYELRLLNRWSFVVVANPQQPGESAEEYRERILWLMPGGPQHHKSRLSEKEIVERAKAGESVKAIAKDANITRQRVYIYLRRRGVVE